MPATTGVPYFIENYTSIPLDTYKIHYTFSNPILSYTTGTVGEQNSVITEPQFSGKFLVLNGGGGLGSTYPTYSGERTFNSIFGMEVQNSSSGLFSGNNFSFSALTNNAIGPIFSNCRTGILSGEVLNLGFSFGINKANRLYFEYFDKDGPKNYTLNNPLSDCNSLLITVLGDNLTLGYYDFFQNQTVSENFNINSKYLFPNNSNWNIGSRSGISGTNIQLVPEQTMGPFPPGQGSVTYLTYPFHSGVEAFLQGSLDEFIFFNRAIDNSDWGFINSGFAFSYRNNLLISGYISINEITGYQTGVVGISTGITGYIINETGVIVDEFGNEYSGTSITPLTGVETGLGIIPLSGIVQYPIVTGNNSYLTGDINFIHSFGKLGANTFQKSDNYDSIAWTFCSGLWSDLSGFSLYNEAYFDRAKGLFTLPSLKSTQREVGLFLNGLFQTSGSPVVTGSIYYPEIISTGDYYLSGKRVYSSDFFQSTDSLIYDVIPNHKLSTITGFFHNSGNGNIFLCSGANSLIFFNGQKLDVSTSTGVLNDPPSTYRISGGSCFILNNTSLFEGATGTLSVISNLPTGFFTVGGSGSSSCLFKTTLTVGSFPIFSTILSMFLVPPKSSMGFLNGIRLSTDNFIEFGINDLLSGNSSLIPKDNLIYDNNALFFE